MEIIPVIDVKGGIVVQAIGGHREQYQPLKSKLTDSVRPLDVARAMLKVTGSDKLYVADLDAIEYGQKVDDTILELVENIDAQVWLDAGCLDIPGAEPIDCTEEVSANNVMTRRFIREGGSALSIDFRDGRYLGGDHDPLSAVIDGIVHSYKVFIILDLGDVGIQRGGSTIEFCQRVIANTMMRPHQQLWTGGGIRDWGDIRFLERVGGVDGVLVSTALHQGAIR